MMYQTRIPSPVGLLTLASDGAAITGLWIEGQKYYPAVLEAQVQPELPAFLQAKAWLEAYFQGAPLPAPPSLAPAGSPFRQAVWRLLLEIPQGETSTYGQLSQKLQAAGISASPQSVGGAVGHNPISILIPCHRVLGWDGNLTGYAGGMEKKRFLLELEGIKPEKLVMPKRGSAL